MDNYDDVLNWLDEYYEDNTEQFWDDEAEMGEIENETSF